MSTEQRQGHARGSGQSAGDCGSANLPQIVLETALQMGTGYITPQAFQALGAVLSSRAASGLLNVAGKVVSPSGLLGAWGAGLTVTGAWYNADEWYADFVLAQHALALRKAFETGVNSLRQTAARQARVDPEAYDGELAESYKAAFLLEMLAAVESQRLFSDGYEAIFRTPNVLTALDRIPLPIRPAARPRSRQVSERGGGSVGAAAVELLESSAYEGTAVPLAFAAGCASGAHRDVHRARRGPECGVRQRSRCGGRQSLCPFF